MTNTTRSTPAGSAAAYLARLRSLARAMLVTQRLGWVLAWMLAILLLAGVVDFFLRTPTALRVVLWLIGAVVLVGIVRRVVWPAFGFRPSLTEVALRVENSEQGRRAGLQGLLASGLELSGSPQPSRFAEPVIVEASRRLSAMGGSAGGMDGALGRRAGVTSVLAPTATVRSMVWLLAAVLAVAVVAVLEPGLTRIGATRILWPIAGAEWPKRTGVVDITGVKVHPLGSALALRAAVTRASGSAASERVAAHYRTLAGVDGAAGPLRRILLTAQDRHVRIAPGTIDAADAAAGLLFERLLEPSGLGAESARAADAPTEMTLEYWFETADDRTDPVRVLLVEPPSVVRATAEIAPPAYAAATAPATPPAAPIDLGPGSDQRAAAPPALAGSRISVRIELNKPLPGAPAGADAIAWAERSLGPDAAALLRNDPAASLSASGSAWRLSWTLAEPVRLAVKPIDEHGIRGVEESNYRFDALRDNPPSVVVTAPMEDKSVLATAIVDLAAEARDDVGLVSLALEHQTARRPKGSEGAPAEPVGERVELSRGSAAGGDGATDPAAPADGRRLTVTHTFDLSALELTPGDEVWITAAAMDAFELNGARHGTVRSAARRLRIMSREELVQQVWAELSSVRRAAMKIDEDQREIARATSRTGPDEARRAQRAQAGISERLASQAAALEQLADRIDENGLTDQVIGDVLEQADRALARAGEESVRAADSLNKAEQAESQESAPADAGAADREQAAQAQEEVREELSRLIDMLDQGEDTYAARRSLEQVLQQQQSLMERTQKAGQSTTGKSAEQLTPQEQQQLQQIAEEQRDAAQKLQDAIDKMLEREKKLEKNDAAAAQQMAQAAQRGQREQVAQKMQQAAQQVQQNQTNTAQQQQSRAIQSLQDMLKELDKTSQARDEVLRRYLASLMDSLRALIENQQSRLDELDAAIPEGRFDGLDVPMARLHQATLGVLDEAAGAPREAADALALIERAAEAQSAAVVALRDRPVNPDEARDQEQLSLDKLNEALELAEKIDEAAEERQQDRKRAELRQKYEEALKTQIGIRDSAAGLIGAEASRRNRAAARQLGQDEQELRVAVEAIRTDLKEIKEAKVFDYAHTRLNDLMTASAATMSEGLPTAATGSQLDAAVRTLAALVDALDDRKKDDRKFREREQDQQGGGGGSGNDPLVPPAAEIKLLRLMQQEAAERTREIGENRASQGSTLTDVTRLQRDLADQAKELLERLSNQDRPGRPEAPPGMTPAPQPEEPAEPEAQP